MKTIEEIVKLLKEAKKAYYSSPKPIMSDPEYDALEDELRILDPDHPFFDLVGYEEDINVNDVHPGSDPAELIKRKVVSVEQAIIIHKWLRSQGRG